MASTAANNSQCQELQLAHLASQQNMMHENMHQLIAGLNTDAFNISNKGCSLGQFGGQGNYGGSYGGCSCGWGRPIHRGCGFPPTCMYGRFPLPVDLSPVICHRPRPQVHHQDSQAHPKVAVCNLIGIHKCQGSLHQVCIQPLSIHPKYINNSSSSQTRSNATPTGTCATRVVLTCLTVTQACHAQPIFEKPHMTSTSRDKTPSNILIWDIHVAPKTCTKCSYQPCDG
jgi:hypothetical protein